MEEPIEEEIWRSIEGYEGLYEVSNLGRVRSLDRYGNTGYGIRLYKGKILSQVKNRCGYLNVVLSKKCIKTIFTVHRLVARAFPEICGQYKDVLQVDHINTVRTDNRAINLRWVTRSENQNNPLTIQHFFNANKGKNKGEKCYWYGKFGKEHHRSIPIVQYDRKGNFISEFSCAAEAERKLNIDHRAICRVLKGQRNHTHGFIFKYKNPTPQNKAI